jgi:predicted ABC-type ATPase
MAKWMWIVAGPNGAGKSTFTNQFLADLGSGTLKKLNADERTLALRRRFPEVPQDELNFKAAVEIDAEVKTAIGRGQSFLVETVLSSQKYRDDVLAARASKFRFGLIYISLYPPELSPRRILERVSKGGHDVNPAKAIERYHRSHAELKWFAPHADLFMAFDNSDPNGRPVLVATRSVGKPLQRLHPGLNPAIDSALAGFSNG